MTYRYVLHDRVWAYVSFGWMIACADLHAPHGAPVVVGFFDLPFTASPVWLRHRIRIDPRWDVAVFIRLSRW